MPHPPSDSQVAFQEAVNRIVAELDGIPYRFVKSGPSFKRTVNGWGLEFGFGRGGSHNMQGAFSLLEIHVLAESKALGARYRPYRVRMATYGPWNVMRSTHHNRSVMREVIPEAMRSVRASLGSYLTDESARVVEDGMRRAYLTSPREAHDAAMRSIREEVLPGLIRFEDDAELARAITEGVYPDLHARDALRIVRFTAGDDAARRFAETWNAEHPEEIPLPTDGR